MEYQNKYLEFKQVPYEGKTKRFEVISIKHGYSLGRISWHGAWRCYVFSPAFVTIWNKDCLKDIQDFFTTINGREKKIKTTTVRYFRPKT